MIIRSASIPLLTLLHLSNTALLLHTMTATKCLENETRCKDSRFCILTKTLCDGKVDCLDSSDEVNCAAKCLEDETSCKDGLFCILTEFICDGDIDCLDRSDESDCETFTCSAGFIKCRDDRQCIWARYMCDGTDVLMGLMRVSVRVMSVQRIGSGVQINCNVWIEIGSVMGKLTVLISLMKLHVGLRDMF